MIQNPLPHDHGQTIEQELEHMPSVENFQTVADIFKQKTAYEILVEVSWARRCV